MSETQKRLEHMEAQRRAVAFNTEYSQAAMEMVFGERRRQVRKGRRQVRKGRAEDIPYPCEAADTADIMRMGVLGEEFGEVCTAIIERQGMTRELEEYCHVAAVALACMEGMMRKMGVKLTEDGRADIYAPEWQRTDEGPPQLADLGPEDFMTKSIRGHGNVLNEAQAVYAQRTAKRGELWRRMGMRGNLISMRICMERLWERYWTVDPEADIDVDDALDLINFSVFLIRSLREGEPAIRWVYPDQVESEQ